MADTREARIDGLTARIRRADDDTTRAALIALRRLLTDSKATLAAAGFNDVALTATSPAWLSAIDAALAPAIVRTFTEAWDEIAGGTVEASPYAARHLESVHNRLVRVPDTVFDTIRSALDEGRQAGEGIPELSRRVDALMADQERWRNRAVVIARTEVIAANNEGQRNAAGAIADASGVPRNLVAKEWLATSDRRTRDTHLSASGQKVIGLDTPFQVGGSNLIAPGDPNGPGDEVIQCRCTVLYHFPGDADYPSLTAAAATVDSPETGDTMSEQTPEPETAVVENAWHGVWTVEDVLSGDGRMFGPGVLRARALPLPLLFMPENQEGHGGAVLAGRADKLVRAGTEIRAEGVWDTEGENGVEARRLLTGGFFRGVSVDADDAKAEFQFPDGSPVPADWWPQEGDPEPIMVVTDGRVAAATMTPIPAFQEAWIKDGPAPAGFMDGSPLEGGEIGNPEVVSVGAAVAAPSEEAEPDTQGSLDAEAEALLAEDDPDPGAARALLGRYEAVGATPPDALVALADEATEDAEEVAASLVAAALPQVYRPPATHFTNPGFRIGDGRVVQAVDGSWGCPLTITDDGHVFGHVAKWGTCHVGPQTVGSRECVTPPFSGTNYAYFAVGSVTTDDNTQVPVGQVTFGTGHADGRLGLRAAAAHYDNTGSAFADVAVGQDDLGIWISGHVRPGTKPETVYAAKATGKVSGDWRDVAGNLEMVAALVVNVPGFPMPRMAAGLQHNHQVSLVASGAVAEEAEHHEVTTGDGTVVRAVAARVRRLARIDALTEKIGEDPRSRYQRAAALIGED